ncbi:hypothetical protein V493_06148 [Pseudogymnoascus sp. VKM F-4281 (FW-2241)]|nr:hypothetical protein V493_06148 [Pseudogymnoascus sp. VKM F-4281 (FW-2241)]
MAKDTATGDVITPSDSSDGHVVRHRTRSIGHLSNGPDGERKQSNAAQEGADSDDARLQAEFGYKPVFKREFGYLSTFSFAVSISGLFATTMTTYSYPLAAGGPAAAVWCWLIAGSGSMCLAFSVAELVSAYPTSGGLYYTVSRLAPKKYVPVVSWITGWINLLGQIAGVASSEYGAAQMLLAAVSMGTDFKYEITENTTVGVMAALTVLTGLVNSMSTYWIEKMTKGYVIFHIAVLLSCCIALLVKTENKNSASFVFAEIESNSGWQPKGFSFLFGFLSVAWTMTDYDATAHITEEISNPAKKAPWAISAAMTFTYIGGFLFNIVLGYCMGPSTTDILGAYQPVAMIFYNSLGKTGGIFYTVCGFIIIKFVCFTALQATARTFFAFSRDRLIPFSHVWTQVSPITGTPLTSVWISVILCILINLIGLGSYTAISGVFNVCAISLDISYCIPIACKVIFGKFKPGPWHMGRYSTAINTWACIWTAFVSVIFILPTEFPVAADTMNYACVFLVAMFVFSYLYWVVRGNQFYTGPIVEGYEAPQGIVDEQGSGESKATELVTPPPYDNSEKVA